VYAIRYTVIPILVVFAIYLMYSQLFVIET